MGMSSSGQVDMIHSYAIVGCGRKNVTYYTFEIVVEKEAKQSWMMLRPSVFKSKSRPLRDLERDSRCELTEA
jgi:hypothetical protein